ncbi:MULTISPECIES: Nif11-like leader peptide family natural product precursor [unclassified Tolypothrix]|uniref:Nif11-like leader peptide family natural product precursor n=1 Tax=unclassified Tolypothrix TaxID=2649714 RepID=UPI0005EAA50F|nr:MULTISPECIES: Nif11-like leader peptide family natural product precursor [unclassified Tolypothrix]BAY92397.1 hypothetical protein NIES3275_44320 [Microchaete diplosiphon NIES-3275]EKF05916.1 hypothetical protein FDUTEX481_00267 [Tolypothrix sp. PCC 7601]MBE9086263.1 Nif11-like leader peptide family natural product precursor [Tolypothrix sp. LEGE 11397]UYD26359.1 Nif11-like leader peptide family natural product precursor [Tolypothrix sp. PCC 7712]UYD31405.1 Nif11-like leader peptide family 
MSEENAMKFLKLISKDNSLLEKIKPMSRDEIVLLASQMGYDFTKEEYTYMMSMIRESIERKEVMKFRQLLLTAMIIAGIMSLILGKYNYLIMFICLYFIVLNFYK